VAPVLGWLAGDRYALSLRRTDVGSKLVPYESSSSNLDAANGSQRDQARQSTQEMKKKVNRNVNVGDLVIQKKPSRNIEINTGKYPYIGVVYEMKVVHSYDTVFIHWSPENPPDYRPEYGLTRLGIHNLRSTYDVINK
tara:strand:+ start:505 stop:918 length:414 start_codon:yes stop_codon:yes gene_type:complete